MTNWYLIQTKVANENLAVENLKNQNFTTYFPVLIIKNKTKPLFPRYIFVQQVQNQDVSPIKSTKGVVNIVRFGNEAAIVADKIIQDLQNREKIIAGKIIAKNSLQQGDDIEVLDGVFAGNKAIFANNDGDKRSILLLKLLGKEHKISIENQQIKKY